CAVAVLVPSTAGAFSIPRYSVTVAEAKVIWHVGVCGAQGAHILFRAHLRKEDGYGREVEATWRSVESRTHECTMSTLRTPDTLYGGLWETRVTVVARGQKRNTRWYTFDNGEEQELN